jgi:hypothetical protein
MKTYKELKEATDDRQIEIAKKILKMNTESDTVHRRCIVGGVMGGMNTEEARDVLMKKAGWSAEEVKKYEDS